MDPVSSTASRLRRALCIVACLVWGTTGASAQLIPIKTAPVATGSQFQIAPAQRYGMGNVTLAVDDPLGDVFVNPATASRLRGTHTFAAPTHYAVTGRDGSASTASAGVVARRGAWFGGGTFAVQQMDLVEDRRIVAFGGPTIGLILPVPDVPDDLHETSARNTYVTGLVGRTLTDRWALAGAVRWAHIDAMDGVDMLYPQHEGILQDGHRLDLRAGLVGTWGDATVQAVLVHDRVDVTHRVTDARFQWNEDTQERTLDLQTTRNLDRTNTWGLHLEYAQDLAADGWRLGTVLTGNRKSHPKIPNFEFMNIPRDPGTSWAYNMGVGVARQTEHVTLAADAIFAPIFSDTWAEAEAVITRPDSSIIEPGERTIENDFEFANTTLRLGGRFQDDWLSFRAGAQVHTIRYWLTQQDNVVQSERDQYEAWSEWNLTGGPGVTWGNVQVRYTFRWTLGTGRVSARSPARAEFSNLAGGDMVVAPSGALTTDETDVFTHQVTITVALDGAE
jgi:hypothetical protein